MSCPICGNLEGQAVEAAGRLWFICTVCGWGWESKEEDDES